MSRTYYFIIDMADNYPPGEVPVVVETMFQGYQDALLEMQKLIEDDDCGMHEWRIFSFSVTRKNKA